MRQRTTLALVLVCALWAFAPNARAEEGSTYGKKDGMLWPVVLGPKVGFGFPTPIQFGLEGRYLSALGFSFDYGMFPSMAFSNVSVKLSSWNLAAKYFVWGQAFFVGLKFGSQTFDGSMTNTISGISTTATTSIKTTFLTPHIGWRWTWESGFFMGMEIGAQVALSADSTTTTNADATIQSTADYAALIADIDSKGKTLGRTTIPILTLIQFGYYF